MFFSYSEPILGFTGLDILVFSSNNTLCKAAKGSTETINSKENYCVVCTQGFADLYDKMLNQLCLSILLIDSQGFIRTLSIN